MIYEPLKAESLVESFVKKFEDLILSGKIIIGQKLPSERELAIKMNVSRPIVHEGLIILQQKGLVTLKPRKGAIVNDFRKQGSIELLQSIINYYKGNLESHIFESMLSFRKLFEIETARLAAINRTMDEINTLNSIILKEKEIRKNLNNLNLDLIVELDFEFHHTISIASGNFVYPLIINSFKKVYTNLTRQFFLNSEVLDYVYNKHEKLTKAIIDKDTELSVKIMQQILKHGENNLRAYIDKQN